MSSRADFQAELDSVRVLNPSPFPCKRLKMEMSFSLPPIPLPWLCPCSPSGPGWLRGQVLLSPPVASGSCIPQPHSECPGILERKQSISSGVFKWISGLDGPDKALSWAFQHILLALTRFPSGFCRSPPIILRVSGSRSLSTNLV